MSKKQSKQLLNEGTIRSFMKLAKLDKLSEGFIDSLKEEEDEEELPGEESEELPPPAPAEMPEEVPEEEPMGMSGGNEEMVEKIVSAVASAIEDVTGVPVSVEGGEEMEMGDELGGEEEMGGDVPPAPMPDEEEELDEGGDQLPDPPEEIVYNPDESLKKKGKKLQEDESEVSGDRSKDSEDLRELPAHEQIVETEEVNEDKTFGGTKDAKLKPAKAPKKVQQESKKKLTKEQMISEITKRIVEKLSKSKKK